MEDKQIVSLYWARDPQAIDRSQEKYGPYCLSIARNILRQEQDAEESVNDTWLGAWNAMPPHRPAVLRLFLGKLTRRLSLQRLRRQGRLKRGGGEAALALEELGDCVPLGGDAQQALEGRELTRLLNRFLSGLPAAQRQVFLARYWYGAAVKDIARQFGYSESKVKSMLYRTREKLRLTLEKEGYCWMLTHCSTP